MNAHHYKMSLPLAENEYCFYSEAQEFRRHLSLRLEPETDLSIGAEELYQAHETSCTFVRQT